MMMADDRSRATEFTKTLESDAADYGVELSTNDHDRLAAYYTLLESWNPRLHLVAPCSPQEFARRHVLESLLIVPHLSKGARVADIGSGAGLPIVPCLIARSDIKATLIESSKKKAVFLREALNHIEAQDRSRVLATRYEDIKSPRVEFVTCRALDRFTTQLPALINWVSPSSTLLFFGGVKLREGLQQAGFRVSEIKIPNSEKRLLLKAERTVTTKCMRAIR
jgi:16S rRNA (guanine527-N7)-methyltransferase